MTYHQVRGDKKAQKPSLQFLVLRLSSFTIVTWVELILCLDRASSVRFYLCSFFDMMDIACINSYLIYNMKHPNKLPLLDYKTVVAKNLIQYLWGRKRAVPMSRPSKRKNQPIVRKGVPATPLFKAPIPWPSLPPPFFKSSFSLPSFLFHPLSRYFRQFPSTSHNPYCPNPTNQPTKRAILPVQLSLSIKNQFLIF